MSDNLAYSLFHVIENVRGKAVAKMTLLKDSEMSTKTKILAHNHEFLRAMTREEIAVITSFHFSLSVTTPQAPIDGANIWTGKLH